MSRQVLNSLLAAAIVAALFSLYSAFSFLTLADISTPEQISRVNYDRNCWLGIFSACAGVAVVLIVCRRRLPPGN